MNKNIISIVIGILVLGGLIWFARPAQNNNAVSASSNGILTVEETNNYDFGTISMGKGLVRHTFKIRNESSEAVLINKMYTSCMCTTASILLGGNRFGPYGMPGHSATPSINQAVNPEEEAEIEVVFDPAAHGPAGVGKIQRVVIIENNAGRPVELSFTAMVTP